MEYKRSIGINIGTNFKKKEKALWNATTIFRILENPVYIGITEQNKFTTPNYKIKKRISVPKENRIVVENTHQPIISREVFEKVQKLMKIDTRISYNQDKVYLLSGILKCDECNSSLIRKNNGTKETPYFYYICSNAKNKNGCKSVSINSNLIEKIILEIIQKQVKIILNDNELLELFNIDKYILHEKQKIEILMKEKEKELIKYENIKLNLIKDFKEGILTKLEYEYFNNLYFKEIENVQKIILKFNQDLCLLLSSGLKENILNKINIKILTRELVVNLIDRIVINKDKSIKIYFNYDFKY